MRMFEIEEIKHLLNVCHQCGTCVSTCAAGMVHPAKNVRKLVDQIAHAPRGSLPAENDLLWFCTTCYQCQDRCPEGVPLTSLLLQLRNMAAEKGALPTAVRKEIDTLFEHGFTVPPLKTIRSRRRKLGLPELPPPDRLEMETLIQLSRPQRPLPDEEGGRGLNDRRNNRPGEPMRYALFIGCLVAYKLPHIEAASRFVLDALGVQTVDLPFSCCPDPNGVHAYNSELWATLAARNLALAEAQGLDLITLCSGCYATLNHCRQLLRNDTRLKRSVNARLQAVGRRFCGESRVIHFYQLLHERIGYERLQQQIAAPLDRLKIAVHYGCHSLRPRQMNPPEDPENPQWLWEFAEKVLGAETRHYLDETQCCGAGMREMDQARALDLTARKIRQMEETGANAILVPCPACYLQFDAGQRLLLREDRKRIVGTAVFYQAELLAISMGADPTSIGMQFHLVKPDAGLLRHENF